MKKIFYAISFLFIYLCFTNFQIYAPNTGEQKILNATKDKCPIYITFVDKNPKNKYKNTHNYRMGYQEYISKRGEKDKEPVVYHDSLSQSVNGIVTYTGPFEKIWTALIDKKTNKIVPNSTTWGEKKCDNKKSVAMAYTAPKRHFFVYAGSDSIVIRRMMRLRKDADTLLTFTPTELPDSIYATLQRTLQATDQVLFIRDKVNNIKNEKIETLLIDKGIRYIVFVDNESGKRERQTQGGDNLPKTESLLDDNVTPAFCYLHFKQQSEVLLDRLLEEHFMSKDKLDWITISELYLKNNKDKFEYRIGYF